MIKRIKLQKHFIHNSICLKKKNFVALFSSNNKKRSRITRINLILKCEREYTQLACRKRNNKIKDGKISPSFLAIEQIQCQSSKQRF